jgi:hypothetical protein
MLRVPSFSPRIFIGLSLCETERRFQLPHAIAAQMIVFVCRRVNFDAAMLEPNPDELVSLVRL